MRKFLVVAAMMIGCSLTGFAWNCSDPLAERVVVPSTTTGTYGDADGQLALYNGLVYECEVVKITPPPPTTPPTSTTTNNNNSSSTSGATANSGSNSTSGASAAGGTATGGNSSSNSGVNGSGNSSSTSKGGNSTATGGQGGAGGSVSGSGNSTNVIAPVITDTNTLSNRNTLSNSGNSSNTNTNTAKGGSANGNGSNNTTSQGQTQSQANTSSNANQSSASNQANGNGSNSNDTTNNVYAAKIPVSTAYAPTTFPTSPCLKSYSGGGQGTSLGVSFGGSKVDKNCALLETARAFDTVNERLPACKIKVSSEYAKKAGVTLADCMAVAVIIAPAPVAAVVPAPIAPQVIVVQVPTPAPVQPAVVAGPVSNFQGFFVRLDNVSKARLDGTVLLLKNNLDGHLRLRYNPANAPFAKAVVAYLTSNGIDTERLELRDDGAEQGVEAIFIQ
jgi:hypothetical protein